MPVVGRETLRQRLTRLAQEGTVINEVFVLSRDC